MAKVPSRHPPEFYERDTPTDPVMRPMRSEAPSFSDLAADITGSHRLDSTRPSIIWIDRRISRPLRKLAFWLARTGWGTLTAAIVAFLSAWLSHKLTHWMGP